jgi:pyruvate,water dikinase
MGLILPLDQVRPEDIAGVGGKCLALARMLQNGFQVPETLCVSTKAYEAYVERNGLRERILLELHRKDFEDMRWEEMWDASLRIRNMFLTSPMPARLARELGKAIGSRFGTRPVVVRSSAPAEDSSRASFAGLHESFVNVHGVESILDHVRKVWASLWSDAALLYRQELGLDVETSTMAVAIQEIVVGTCSGVAFGVNPNDPSQAVIESVYGLNQGLVDGAVEPDRWILDREQQAVVEHHAAERESRMAPCQSGVSREPLPPELSQRPPLDSEQISTLFRLTQDLEQLFGSPQDVEWTFREGQVLVLQSRPVTAGSGTQEEGQRSWYLSLRKSYENLKAMRAKIEQELIPEMIKEAETLRRMDLTSLPDIELAGEIRRRTRIVEKWTDTYWTEFIPFAHGTRLFGQIYNDNVRPSDPYEFVDLLSDSGMVSVERNRMLEALADRVRESPDLARRLRAGKELTDTGFADLLDRFIERFGALTTVPSTREKAGSAVVRLALEMASVPPPREKTTHKQREGLEADFLAKFEGERRQEALELLDLARASYRLRDDDNIYLGRIEAQLERAVELGKDRLETRRIGDREALPVEEIILSLKDPSHVPCPRAASAKTEDTGEEGFFLRARQLIGQPAGPGISKGLARVILESSDLLEFKSGEILVCDAVDPNMTFVIPLAGGVVERRGGMLIHGAIIAREYGLPCVTGVPEATRRIQNGDTLTVDGYLGIVILGEDAED